MSSQANCRLTFGGVLLQHEIHGLVTALRNFGAKPFVRETLADHTGFGIADHVLCGTNVFEIEEVREGNLPRDLEAALQSCDLSFCWISGPYQDQDGTIRFQDAVSGVNTTFYCGGDQISLTLDEIATPGMIQAARYWEAFGKALVLRNIESHHDLAGLASTEGPLQPYALKALDRYAKQKDPQ